MKQRGAAMDTTSGAIFGGRPLAINSSSMMIFSLRRRLAYRRRTPALLPESGSEFLADCERRRRLMVRKPTKRQEMAKLLQVTCRRSQAIGTMRKKGILTLGRSEERRVGKE